MQNTIRDIDESHLNCITIRFHQLGYVECAGKMTVTNQPLDVPENRSTRSPIDKPPESNGVARLQDGTRVLVIDLYTIVMNQFVSCATPSIQCTIELMKHS